MKLYFENKRRINESANGNYLNSIISNLKQLANSEEYLSFVFLWSKDRYYRP